MGSALTGFNYIALVGSHSRSRRRSRSALGNRCSENQSHYPALEAPRQRRGLESHSLGPTPCVLCPMSSGLSPGPQSSVPSPQTPVFNPHSSDGPHRLSPSSHLKALSKRSLKRGKKKRNSEATKEGNGTLGRGLSGFPRPVALALAFALIDTQLTALIDSCQWVGLPLLVS